MSRPRSPFEERRHRLELAKDSFLRAAALLLDADLEADKDNVPCAVLFACAGLVHLNRADHTGKDGERAAELAEAMRTWPPREEP